MNPTSSNCLNCQAPLAAAQTYCGRCGQKAGAGKLDMHQVWHDLVHSLLHVDRSALALLRALATRPGGVARDYADGMRRRYFGPFAFLVVAISLASAAIAASGFTNLPPEANAEAGVAALLQRHVNLLYLLQVPLLALFSLLLFRAGGRNFAEHLVLAAYASGMRAIAIIVLLVPLWLLLRRGGTQWMLYGGYFALWVVYYATACAQFFEGRRALSFLKGAIAALLVQGLTVGAVNGANTLVAWMKLP